MLVLQDISRVKNLNGWTKTLKMNKKYLRREDIKSGMLVEYRGELCLVVGSTSGLCLCGINHWCPLDDAEMWRITKVYDRTHPRDARKLEIGDRQLVWEGRSIVVELTLQEIADRLCIPVEQLRIKD